MALDALHLVSNNTQGNDCDSGVWGVGKTRFKLAALRKESPRDVGMKRPTTEVRMNT
jgi:hypothetical protein